MVSPQLHTYILLLTRYLTIFHTKLYGIIPLLFKASFCMVVLLKLLIDSFAIQVTMDSDLTVQLSAQYNAKLAELFTIYQHVSDISHKIAEMDDPLPEQLQQSIPGYLDQLQVHTQWLQKRTWSFVLFGEF